jgi:nitroreductase
MNMFTEPVEQLIKKRVSVRTYSRQPVPKNILEKLQEYIRHPEGPFDAEVRFALLDKPMEKSEAGIKLGTYGVIQGASLFIGAAMKKQAHSPEQLGYALEKVILFCTSLGLGTCWLAGSFNKGSFSAAMDLSPEELLPIVAPMGYPGALRGPVDILFKPLPAIRSRKPSKALYFENSFQNPLADAGAYKIPLEMVRLAPSAANRQPWRIVRLNGQFHFYLAHDPLNVIRSYDVQKVDMGIAMCHFELTAKEAGQSGKWAFQEAYIPGAAKELEYIATWVPEGAGKR